MRILIVQDNEELGGIWQRFLEREGISVVLNTSQEQAIKTLRFEVFDALILELVLPDGGAIAIADFATYKSPDVPVIPVTSSSFFSDGSVFSIIPNARSLMRMPVEGKDLLAMLEHSKRKPSADNCQS